jgi:hypothetical protein
MRMTLKERRRKLHRNRLPLPRIMSMTLMLAIMALIFVRLRNPDAWRWFAQDKDIQLQSAAEDDAAIVKKVAATVAAQPAAIRPPAKQQPAGQAAATGDSAKKPVLAKEPVPTNVAVAGAPPAPPVPPANSAKGSDSLAKEPVVSKKAPGVPPELVPTGPTDLDPIEQDDIKQSIGAVSDGELKWSDFEMPAYTQILGWVDHQSIELLRKRAKKDVTYSDFRLTPDTMRLQIVELKLRILQIIRLTEPPKNGLTEPMLSPDGHPLYEVRGFTEEGRSNLYVGIVSDLPKGMPIGMGIDEQARLVGYFFKLQGYYSAEQLLDRRNKAKPLKAPLILGRLVWIESPPTTTAKTPFWLLISVGSVAAVLVIGGVLWSMRKTPRIPRASSIGGDLDADGPTVDDWLDQAQSGRLTLDQVLGMRGRSDGAYLDTPPLGDSVNGRFFGNNPWETGESKNGHGSTNGHGKTGPEVRDNGPDRA